MGMPVAMDLFAAMPVKMEARAVFIPPQPF